jgi:hypothetical protein
MVRSRYQPPRGRAAGRRRNTPSPPRRVHLAQELRDLGLDAAVAGDIDLVAGIDADHADVLDAGLGAVARAAGHRELDLVRRVHVEQHLLQLDAHVHRELRAEAAVLGADAGLHGADRLAVGVAGDHAGGVEVGPHLRAGLPS